MRRAAWFGAAALILVGVPASPALGAGGASVPSQHSEAGVPATNGPAAVRPAQGRWGAGSEMTTESTSGGFCGEASCVPVQGSYISHFTGSDCTGVESYYTPYFDSDGIRRSWDGNGVAGTTLRTVTNRSWKGSDGACHNDWPNGNTLSGFVTIYR